MYSVFTMNYLNDPNIRTPFMLIGFVLVVSGAYLVYFGVGKQIT